MSRDISGPHRRRRDIPAGDIPATHRRETSPAHPGAPTPDRPTPDGPTPDRPTPDRPTPTTGWATWHRDRAAELPHDWHHRRAAVLARDGHRCTWTEHGTRCDQRGSVVDHIADAHDHGLANLRTLCTEHDRARTARQGRDAARRARTRPIETHPFAAEAARARGEAGTEGAGRGGSGR